VSPSGTVLSGDALSLLRVSTFAPMVIVSLLSAAEAIVLWLSTTGAEKFDRLRFRSSAVLRFRRLPESSTKKR
jgi:hypothetical protein